MTYDLDLLCTNRVQRGPNGTMFVYFGLVYHRPVRLCKDYERPSSVTVGMLDAYITRWYSWGIQKLSPHTSRANIEFSVCVGRGGGGEGLGGYSLEVKTQNHLSAKICLNLNFRGGGGGRG